MPDFSDIMKKAQEMQAQMANMQADMVNIEVIGEAGAGLVKVTLDGQGGMKALALDPSLFTEEDKDVVEDLVVAAHKDARARLEAETAKRMQDMTGGLMGGGAAGGMPGGLGDLFGGMKNPFGKG